MKKKGMEANGLHIGTSGWYYNHWQGAFYPRDLPKNRFLDYYAGQFRTVEINNSFYRLPDKGTLRKWRDHTPDDFIFTVKASRYITHMKKLKDPEKPLHTLLDALKGLGNKLGPVLFQLPSKWRLNQERFYDFLEALPAGYRYAFEFRDASWEDEGVLEAMKEIGVSFCIYDLKGRLSPKEITTDFIYVRLHGPREAYKGKYDSKFLSGWAGAFTAWLRQGLEIFCYFDNDEAGYAAADAAKLQEMFES
jgi:uncharacterized protein YecE (DUF72 family)